MALDKKLRSTAGLPILLLGLLGSVVGFSWWSFAPVGDAAPAVIADLDASAGDPGAAAELQEQTVASRRARPAFGRVTVLPVAESTAAREPLPGSERGLRETYLALEAAHPGHLAAHAREWFISERPAAQKVAWLSAMHESDASAALPWLEFACSSSDPASAQGEPPASFALGLLARSSVHDPGARAALGRVAFDADSVELALRRRAATAFAALGDPSELELLGQALLLESDEALRAGVVIALEERSDPACRLAADRLLAWLRPTSAAFLARDGDGSP